VTSSPGEHPRVWEVGTGAPVSTLRRAGAAVTTVGFASAGRRVLTVDDDGVVATWDASSGDLERSERPGGDATWSLEGFPVGTAFSADGARVVTWTDVQVGVFGLDPGRKLSVLDVPGTVESAALSPDGRRAATGGSDEMARIYDVAARRELDAFAHDGAVVSVMLGARADQLITASTDTTARLWDVRTGDELVTFRGHGGELTGASLSPDGRWVGTAGADGSARVWDSETGQEIARFEHPDAVLSVTFDRSGRRVLTLSNDQRARVFACKPCARLDALVRLGRSRVVAALR
jgi:WD40 repeat protein